MEISRRKNKFFDVGLTFDQLKERAILLDSLIWDIKYSISRDWGTEAVRNAMEAFDAAIRAEVFNAVMFRTFPSKTPKGVEAQVALAQEIGYSMSLLAEGVKVTGLRLGEKCVDELKKLGTDVAEYLGERDEEYCVVRAYEVACFNMDKVLTARAMVRAVINLAGSNAVENKPAEKAAAILMDFFYQQSERFLIDKVMFAGLLSAGQMAGGVPITEEMKNLVKSRAYNPDRNRIKYAVMQYLSVGGDSPGSYYTADDEDFRRDIKTRFEEI